MKVFVHCYLCEHIVLEKCFRSRAIVTTDGAFVVESLVVSTGFLFSYFSLFCGLCASLMSRFSLVITLLHRLGVINIILILIYSIIVFFQHMHTIFLDCVSFLVTVNIFFSPFQIWPKFITYHSS
jgi:hypothetical protein